MFIDFYSLSFSRTVFSLWTGNETTIDVMVRSEEIPRVARYLEQKELQYQVVIDDLQKEIDEENHILSEEEMLELEGRKGLENWSQTVFSFDKKEMFDSLTILCFLRLMFLLSSLYGR